MSGNARLASRAHLRCAAKITLLDKTVVEAETLDISPGGMCLRTDKPVVLAQLCAVRFDVLLGIGKREVLVMGQVIYSDLDPAGAYKTGIQFIHVDADSAANIRALLAEAAVPAS